MLGPLVVVSTLVLLGSGIVLVLLGEQQSRHSIVSPLGFRVDWITVHQATFAVWATVTGLHLLGRIPDSTGAPFAMRPSLCRLGTAETSWGIAGW